MSDYVYFILLYGGKSYMIYQVQADSTIINQDNVTQWIQTFTNYILPERKRLGQYYDGENIITKQGAVKNRPNY